jgi:hypothetical protein
VPEWTAFTTQAGRLLIRLHDPGGIEMRLYAD